MLTHELIERLRSLRLTGMADASFDDGSSVDL